MHVSELHCLVLSIANVTVASAAPVRVLLHVSGFNAKSFTKTRALLGTIWAFTHTVSLCHKDALLYFIDK